MEEVVESRGFFKKAQKSTNPRWPMKPEALFVKGRQITWFLAPRRFRMTRKREES